MTDSLTRLRDHLAPHHQEHLLAFWDQLSSDARQRLEHQILALDFGLLKRLFDEASGEVDYQSLAARAESPPAVRADGSGAGWSVSQAREQGEAALRAGKLGMILVAGGQGTRLGFDRPKGMFEIGPLSRRTLFEFHADRLAAVAKRYGVTIPLYIMTSPATHAETEAYLQAHHWLGWSRNDLRLFCQGTMPAVDQSSGRVLLDDHGEIALSPDGHGGMVAALQQSGCLNDTQKRGIEHLFYAQIDNPLVAACDSVLIGHHLMAESDMTTQVVKKRDPLERVGNVVSIDGRVQIIEYSDLPPSAAQMRNPDGSLKLWAGNIAVHVFRTSFLLSAATHQSSLPFHRALKKVPYVNEQGQRVEPDAPNAIKFERFIF